MALLLWVALLPAGCGLFGAAGEAPTPLPTRTPLPTFTPTPLAPPTQPPASAAAAGQPDTAAAAPAPETSALPPEGETAAAVEVTTTEAAPATPLPPTPAEALLTIASDLVNMRSGPGTEFDLVGTAATGESFALISKNAAGDWWQICCVGGQNGWVFGELATVQNGDTVAVATAAPIAAAPAATAEPAEAAPAPAAATAAPADEPIPVESAPVEPAPVEQPAPAVSYNPAADSAGNFDPNAQYQIVQFKVLGLDENNGGIRDSSAQHHIFLTVLDQNGSGVDGAVVRNLAGEKGEVTTGGKGPGKAEIVMYYEPFKLTVAADPSGPVTSQVSNQMGLVFPHLPDLVGKLGDVNYEYGACPTIDIKCQWPIQAIHFSYEITFQKVK